MTGTSSEPGTPGDHDQELAELRRQVAYLEEALQAISSGGVDGVVVGPADQERVYTLSSADRPYRVIVESMGEGAVTVSQSGVILFANSQLARLLGVERDSMVGRDLSAYVDLAERDAIADLLERDEHETRRGEVTLVDAGGTGLPFLVAVTDLDIEDVLVRCLVLSDLRAQKAMEQQRAREAADVERQRVVREMNDTIVQGLVTAEMALDLDQHDYAREVIASTSERARAWIGQLAEGRQLEPGMAVRRTAAGTVRESE